MVAMSKGMRYKMSSERLEELKKELHYLETVREKEVAEQIKQARSFGDLSENSEYDEAKTEQGKLYSRIAEIKRLIENAEIITKSDRTDEVGIGNAVTVLDLEFGSEETYIIVGSQDAFPTTGKLSDDSPLGKGLIGRRVGDEIEIEAPAGHLRFKILKIDT